MCLLMNSFSFASFDLSIWMLDWYFLCIVPTGLQSIFCFFRETLFSKPPNRPLCHITLEAVSVIAKSGDTQRISPLQNVVGQGLRIRTALHSFLPDGVIGIPRRLYTGIETPVTWSSCISTRNWAQNKRQSGNVLTRIDCFVEPTLEELRQELIMQTALYFAMIEQPGIATELTEVLSCPQDINQH